MGDMHIYMPNGNGSTRILLKGVLYTPKIGLTLVSIAKATDAGFCALFRNDICQMFDKRRKVIGQIKKENGLYWVNHDRSSNIVIAASAVETVSIEDLHRRMGHIAPDAAKRLVKEGLVEGLKLDENSRIESCDSCQYAKMTRKPIAKERKEPRTAEVGDLVHSDLWGPSPTQTINKREYYASFTDDHSRWSRVYIQRTKDETFNSYQAYEAWLATQHHKKVKKFHSDRGGEFWSNAFDAHLAKMGTERSFTVHDTPEHNGVSQRLNRTIIERV
jgi:transposase InsO family protein